MSKNNLQYQVMHLKMLCPQCNFMHQIFLSKSFFSWAPDQRYYPMHRKRAVHIAIIQWPIIIKACKSMHTHTHANPCTRTCKSMHKTMQIHACFGALVVASKIFSFLRIMPCNARFITMLVYDACTCQCPCMYAQWT